MMRWRPWPVTFSKKFEAKLSEKKAEGFEGISEGEWVLMAEIRWKGPKLALGSLRRTMKRNFMRGVDIKEEGFDGIAEWNEEFESVFSLSFHKEIAFHPWQIEIRVFNVMKH